MASRQHGSNGLSLLGWIAALAGVVSFVVAGLLLSFGLVSSERFALLSALGAGSCVVALLVGAMDTPR